MTDGGRRTAEGKWLVNRVLSLMNKTLKTRVSAIFEIQIRFLDIALRSFNWPCMMLLETDHLKINKVPHILKGRGTWLSSRCFRKKKTFNFYSFSNFHRRGSFNGEHEVYCLWREISKQICCMLWAGENFTRKLLLFSIMWESWALLSSNSKDEDCEEGGGTYLVINLIRYVFVSPQ